MAFLLTILEGAEKNGTTFAFEEQEVRVGRNPKADLVIKDRRVSGYHLIIRVAEDGEYLLEDLGSANGTLRNGEKVTQARLVHGDVLQIGHIILRFEEMEQGETALSPMGPEGGANEELDRQQTDPQGQRLFSQKTRVIHSSHEESQDALNTSTSAVSGRSSAEHDTGFIRSKGVRPKSTNRVSGSVSGSQEAAIGPGQLLTSLNRSVQPLRTALALQGRGVLSWFRGQRKPIRVSILLLAGLLFCGVALKLYLGARSLMRKTVDHSAAIFAPEQLDANGEPLSYGRGPVQVTAAFRATFVFPYKNGRVTIHYAVAGIGDKKELAIQLNGNVIAFAPMAPERWSEAIQLTLPRKQLVANQENQVAFVNLINQSRGGAEEDWGVQLHKVDEQPLPAPDRALAEQAFRLAKERYKEKDVAPQNLYHAWEYFKKSRDYLELLAEKDSLPVYAEAEQMTVQIEGMLDQKYRDLVFSAEQSEEFRRQDKAKDLYRQILFAFPNQSDSRHQYAKEMLESFR